MGSLGVRGMGRGRDEGKEGGRCLRKLLGIKREEEGCWMAGGKRVEGALKGGSYYSHQFSLVVSC